MDIKFISTNSEKKVFEVPTYNDVEFMSNNDLKLVRDSDYVAQQVAKVLNTDQYSSDYFPNYGTTLNSIRKNPIGNSLLESAVQETIVGAVAYIRALEESPSPSEQITGLDNIIIETQTVEKVNKAVNVSMQVVTAAGEIVKVTI